MVHGDIGASLQNGDFRGVQCQEGFAHTTPQLDALPMLHCDWVAEEKWWLLVK